MQAITALAHLQCCVLYFLDISEQCGYTLEEQLKLFKSIRPLFTNKQVMMVANKTDVISYDSLSAEKRALIEDVAQEGNAEVVPMSNVSEENVGKLTERVPGANETFTILKLSYINSPNSTFQRP